MKKVYEIPEIEVLEFMAEDIITASDGTGLGSAVTGDGISESLDDFLKSLK